MAVRDAVVVGAGHNGLVCAALLARAGLDVLVVERREVAGGAAATEELVPGFRFPTGAYVAHLLDSRVLGAAGVAEEELRLLPLPPRRVVSRGRVLSEREAPEWAEVGSVLGALALGPPPSLADVLAEARRRGLAAEVERFARSSLRELGEADELAPPYFEADPEEPGGPLAYAWTKRPGIGAGVPEGGMGTVARVLERAARAAGAEIALGAEVEAILLGDGVRVAGELLRAHAVVSNAAPEVTLRLAGRAAEPPPGPGAAKAHFALAGEPDLSLLGVPHELGLVHVVGGPGWLPRAFADARAGRWPESSLVELQLPTLRDRSLAPPGSHALSVFAPLVATRLSSSDWDARREQLGDLLLARAAEAIPNVPELVRERVVHTPADLERRFGLPGGAIHHLPHEPALMGSGRPGPRTGLPGLYLCGAGAHPGGEVSGAPGWNAAQAVLADLAGG